MPKKGLELIRLPPFCEYSRFFVVVVVVVLCFFFLVPL